MNLPDDFVFSQSALQDYVDCPRRFELRYLLDVRWPALETEPALQHEIGMMKGQEFHHLLHQHALGVPAEALADRGDHARVARVTHRKSRHQSAVVLPLRGVGQ